MHKGTTIFDGEVGSVFLTASSILFDAVSHTLGKDGLNTAIPTPNSFLSIINDGKTIMENISSPEPAIKYAINTLKESAFATNLNAGDGTTSTTLLQHMLLSNVLNYSSIDNKITHKDIIAVRDKLLEELKQFKKEIKSQSDLDKVIEVALGSKDLVPIVSKAFNGRVTKPALVKSSIDNVETKVINVDGITLDPISIDPLAFKDNPFSLDEEFNIILITQNVSRLDSEFGKLLGKISKSPKKTILLYTEIMPSVMEQILYNIQQGSLALIPVKLQLPLDKLDEYKPEIAKFFNLLPIDEMNPYQTSYLNESVFGNCTGYIYNKDSIVLKNDNKEYQSDILPSKTSVIEVGFITYSQQEEDFRRLEDAIHSSYHAITTGYVIGAGYTLVSLSTYVKDVIEDRGIQEVFTRALNGIHNSLRGNSNYEEYIDYCTENVFDSYKVIEQVILNAFTVVAQVLSIKTLIIPIQ